MTKTRYALARNSFDHFPITFRSDCERTFPSKNKPKGEGLLELIEFYNNKGYDILNSLEELEEKLLAKRADIAFNKDKK